jgi:hypothetical protein
VSRPGVGCVGASGEITASTIAVSNGNADGETLPGVVEAGVALPGEREFVGEQEVTM